MIEEIGVVKSVSAGEVIVTTQMQNACNGCAQRSHCGTGALARTLSDKEREVRFPLPQAPQADDNQSAQLHVGKQVKLGILEQRLLQASFVMYLLPLVSLVIGAVVANALLPKLGLTSELWVIGVTFLWFAATFNGIRIWSRKRCQSRFAPILLGPISEQ